MEQRNVCIYIYAYIRMYMYEKKINRKKGKEDLLFRFWIEGLRKYVSLTESR